MSVIHVVEVNHEHQETHEGQGCVEVGDIKRCSKAAYEAVCSE